MGKLCDVQGLYEYKKEFGLDQESRDYIIPN
jgi:hypothetical protein